MAKEKGADFDQIVSGIKSKVFSPVYFFCGEEDFFIDQLVEVVELSLIHISEPTRPY